MAVIMLVLAIVDVPVAVSLLQQADCQPPDDTVVTYMSTGVFLIFACLISIGSSNLYLCIVCWKKDNLDSFRSFLILPSLMVILKIVICVIAAISYFTGGHECVDPDDTNDVYAVFRWLVTVVALPVDVYIIVAVRRHNLSRDNYMTLN